MAKITIVCGAGIVSGKEVISIELAEGLRAAGEDVVFVTSEWGSGEFAERLREMKIPFYRMRLGFISATISPENLRMTAHQMLYWPKLLFDWWWFLQHERPPAVIHTNWHHLLILWPFLDDRRDIFWLHEVVPDKPHYARFFRALARRVCCIVAVSGAVAESLRLVGVDEEKIQVIHNGITDPSMGVGTSRQGPLNEIAVGIVGQVGVWKGHEDLVRAFMRIAARHNDVRLHIFGSDDRPFADQLKALLRNEGLASRVVWHGYVADRSQIYSQIDVCAVPSRSEDPLPTTAIEAAFFRLPVLATRKGGLPEIVVDQETGLIFDAANPEQFAVALEELVLDPALRATMGAAARLRAERCFGRDRFAGDFLRLLGRAHLANGLSETGSAI
jgi:glycosyltransferase involved in cell wall biosynthesis